MPSYYEVLKLDSNASIEVIEAAIDDQYNQFRRLINHHDPNVVEQANRALRQLEDIRSTLTNDEKRAVYDQSLNFGGLVDLSAHLEAASVPLGPMIPSALQAATQDDPRVYAWKCSQCGTANRIDSTTCSSCGTIIARECPNGCGSVVRLSERYCSKCGKSVEDGLAKMQLEFERAQKQFCDGLRADIQLKRNKIERLNWFVSHPLKKRSELIKLVDKDIDYKPSFTARMSMLGMWVTTCLIGFALDKGTGFLVALFFPYPWFIPWIVVVYQVDVKPRVRASIEQAVQQHQAAIHDAERRFQEEQAKQFDPLLPKPYSITTN